MTGGARFTPVVCFCSLLVWATPAIGKELAKENGRQVVASANATVYVKPDGALLTFAISTNEVTGKSVREANEKQVKKVKDALSAVHLNKVDVKTRVALTSINTLLSAQPNGAGARAIEGKRLRNIFYVTIREKNMDKLREAVCKLAEAATDNGAKPVYEEDDTEQMLRMARGRFGGGGPNGPTPGSGPAIEWLAGDTAAARRDAIRRAVRDALADAQAAVGDAKLNVVQIEVSAANEERRYVGPRGLREPIDDGRIPVRVHVQVTCSY